MKKMVIDFTNVMQSKTAYLSLSEIDKMLQWCYENDKIRDYMLILTLTRTGRRVSEIVGKKPYTHNVGLRPIDLLPDNLIEWDILKKNPIKKKKRGKPLSEETRKKMLLIKEPKRTLKPADHQFMELLKRFIDNNNIGKYDRVFPITRQRVHYIVSHVAKKSEVARPNQIVHPHMFRHSMAINMLKQNPNNPYVLIHVQRLLDHHSLDITQHYTQFTPEDIRKSLEKVFRGDNNGKNK